MLGVTSVKQIRQIPKWQCPTVSSMSQCHGKRRGAGMLGQETSQSYLSEIVLIFIWSWHDEISCKKYLGQQMKKSECRLGIIW